MSNVNILMLPSPLLKLVVFQWYTSGILVVY